MISKERYKINADNFAGLLLHHRHDEKRGQGLLWDQLPNGGGVHQGGLWQVTLGFEHGVNESYLPKLCRS